MEYHSQRLDGESAQAVLAETDELFTAESFASGDATRIEFPGFKDSDLPLDMMPVDVFNGPASRTVQADNSRTVRMVAKVDLTNDPRSSTYVVQPDTERIQFGYHVDAAGVCTEVSLSMMIQQKQGRVFKNGELLHVEKLSLNDSSAVTATIAAYEKSVTKLGAPNHNGNYFAYLLEQAQANRELKDQYDLSHSEALRLNWALLVDEAISDIANAVETSLVRVAEEYDRMMLGEDIGEGHPLFALYASPITSGDTAVVDRSDIYFGAVGSVVQEMLASLSHPHNMPVEMLKEREPVLADKAPVDMRIRERRSTYYEGAQPPLSIAHEFAGIMSDRNKRNIFQPMQSDAWISKFSEMYNLEDFSADYGSPLVRLMLHYYTMRGYIGQNTLDKAVGRHYQMDPWDPFLYCWCRNSMSLLLVR
ncbi:MAG: hypothetical protein TR69_WS6001000162 [candidate division WS6 bacterium OLB20]|uniref:Uncharacterized protein n=1 Tax=candidate division WS6 bacterium OLB20 TaxID=1617426 RepID=A0A136M059_9BACT|nr:MAG: hypothetical protein TR69_WS6001000162 [candidate division WS6 bacterium OLB20]